MQTVHTDPSQLNDFNRIAEKYNFEPLEITDIVREQHGDEVNTDHEQPKQVAVDATVLSGLLRATFDIVCPNWDITDDEITMLVDVYTPVADKYNVGSWLQSVELNAILVTGAVFFSRKGKTRKLAEQPKQIQHTPQEQDNQILGVSANE